MVCEMETGVIEDMDIEAVPSMWPEDVGPDVRKQFNVERPGADQDMLEEVNIIEEPTIVDFKRLIELTNYTEKGSSQLQYLAKQWEYKQANAVRLLKEELDILSKQRKEVELKKLKILEEHLFEEERYAGDKRPISILEEACDIWQDIPRRKTDFVVQSKRVEIDAEYDTVTYWKQRALDLEKLLEASLQREQMLAEKLKENIKNIEKQSSPVEELSQILKRADNFLHFVLQNAPVVFGHQDKELRYRFIYNHFPSLQEEDIIGRTDVEIFSGAGVKESQDFKKEVLEKGLPAKREIQFDTELFGLKTFLIYVEPVFSKAGETIGINYMGMDITDQVKKREKMAKLREEIAVQKAKESELNKTIHITEETMRAKQMLATMSHEIRSPLSGVVSMAEILSTTKLDREQKHLLDVMLSSGDLVLQLINDILDLSKVESGVMKLEATKFRPREVVKHVLQTAAASLRKFLVLEGRIADDVPIEVIGDVLRIRQILTNLISNAIKFTHQGKVGINLYVLPYPPIGTGEECHKKSTADNSTVPVHGLQEGTCLPASQNGLSGQKHGDRNNLHCDAPGTPSKSETTMNGNRENKSCSTETTVWICCDVYDTGIGIPENALPTLFKRYMQASADHARKYGGTGLGLAICKQLVELMGGHLTVSSRENHGSTFTFVLPYKVSTTCSPSEDSDELSDEESTNDEMTEGFFQFQPHSFSSLSSSNGSTRIPNSLLHTTGYPTSTKLNGLAEGGPYPITSNNIDARYANAAAVTSSESQCSSSQINSNLDNQNQPDTNARLQNISGMNSLPRSETTKQQDRPEKQSNKLQKTEQRKERSDTSNHCRNSSCGSEVTMTLEPRILLVEDNKTNIMVTQSMMKKFGQKIDVVTNGIEAVRAVQRRSYDLILMDVFMPVMDGLEATRIIRSFEETGSWEAAVNAGIHPTTPSWIPSSSPNRMPIIAMTANSMSESAEECYENGMDSFVSKPITFQKLKECLERYLPQPQPQPPL
ncbi:histidine kinase 5 [Benincasa hispida]|uniref:histidine kinase 5 n=1 Tax=Benincasa hispida TaxID=102211 RepID=UPI001902B721|nr:histidine kinase 5 [Benincasa hispida]XP_038899361.1 histidine kinase 5 [Benincasa hispida]